MKVFPCFLWKSSFSISFDSTSLWFFHIFSPDFFISYRQLYHFIFTSKVTLSALSHWQLFLTTCCVSCLIESGKRRSFKFHQEVYRWHNWSRGSLSFVSQRTRFVINPGSQTTSLLVRCYLNLWDTCPRRQCSEHAASLLQYFITSVKTLSISPEGGIES